MAFEKNKEFGTAITGDDINFKACSKEKVPQQANNFDCGVFICQYARSLSQDEDLMFKQENMARIRDRIKTELYMNILIRD